MRFLLIFVSSLIIALAAVPPVLKATSKSRLTDDPGEGRKIHKRKVSNSGGIAIFTGFLFSCLIFIPFNLLPEANILLASALIIFTMGLKDDIDGLNPLKKFIAQFAAALAVAVLADLRIVDFYGVLGINELSHFASISFTVVVLVGVINAFNLIDGIDTLAASLGILITCIYCFLFFTVRQYGYAYLSLAFAGALLGFLRYNITPARIFMGDSGSLLLGFVVAVLSVRLLNTDLSENLFFGPLHITSGVALVIAILILPIFDTLRVFIIRLFNRKSPFEADSNHIHHRLLKIGLTHIEATIVLVMVNVILISIAILLQPMGNNLVIIIIVMSVLILNAILSTFNMIKLKRAKATKI